MNIKSEKPYIDFYRQYKISPVSQDISNLEKHFERRKFLYRRLGIVGSFLKGKSIIEFGPGSGHNALYTYSLQPSKYILVDGNPTGLRGCEELFGKYFPGQRCHELVMSLIEEYENNELFDLVLCEGLLAGQQNPEQCLRSVAKFTKPGGTYLITTQDCVGYLSDFLRCLIGGIVIKEDMSLEEKTRVLLTTFEGHFAHLKGMSRSYEDWILDNVLHKAFWGNKDTDLLSIENAIRTLDASFDVYGVSPSFFVDWRWYKDVYGDNKNFNQIGIDCYRKSLHNLLDCRYAWAPRPAEENMNLLRICLEIRRFIACFAHEECMANIDGILEKTRELEVMIRTFSKVTADALADFNSALKLYPAITPKTDWGDFSSWWGRGTQYLSFIRNENTKV